MGLEAISRASLMSLGDYFGMTALEYANESDLLMDGILLPADGIGGTAAAPDSWGLIKASLFP